MIHDRFNVRISRKKKIPRDSLHKGRARLTGAGRIKEIEQRMLLKLCITTIEKPGNTPQPP
jgi:hypothetical protein